MTRLMWVVITILLLGLSGFLGVTACYYARKTDIYEHESGEYQKMLRDCMEEER